MTSLTVSKTPEAERALRRKIRAGLNDWVDFVLRSRGQAAARHHREIIGALEDVSSGTTSRLMLLLPPGSAKSTIASLLFPAWWMARNPGGSVITACHTAGLANHFGRGVRSLLAEHGPRLNVALRADCKAAGRFLTEQGGEYFAVGVGGAVTGRRADLALIDDPIMGFEDAENPASRQKLWNWYRTELVTRLKPQGRVILVMTRWHQDDLAGRLMTQDGWRTIRLPALAEADDPLGRAEGDALWPAWESREAILAKKASMGESAFAALFQQAPLVDAGSVFRTERVRFSDVAPHGKSVRGWDLASSSDLSRDPDWTAGVKLLRDQQGAYWVTDVRRMRGKPDEVAAFIVATAAQDGESVTIGLPADPGQAGQFQVMHLVRLLAGYTVRSSPERGSKVVRAEAASSQVDHNNVTLLRAAWNQAFLDELALFPNGPKDDQVDAFSRAFGMLTVTNAQTGYVSIGLMGR
jgi:predicted phage terminase large subunit-like protein